ncbi:MAG: putative membrane protein [Cytophagales bacterium]|jgi:hypothetical protein|nr:DUF2892 domain-containing protein [Bacteroidota bacterium]MBS1980969.1 DUF2892 domain-containing protein [Bacteroidota bacterium]WHZ08328.1 MAG: putative membrane protein [Cytophagales bacterium]
MKKNMGSADRVIRLLAAVIIAVLYFTNQITGTTAAILAILSIVLVVTSFISFCPLYLPFGITTKNKSQQ